MRCGHGALQLLHACVCVCVWLACCSSVRQQHSRAVHAHEQGALRSGKGGISVYPALACLMQSATSVCAVHMQQLLSSLASCVRLCGILGLRCRLLFELRTLACP